MKRSSASLVMREMQIRPQWEITTHLSEGPKEKAVTTTNAGENVEKLDHSNTAGAEFPYGTARWGSGIVTTAAGSLLWCRFYPWPGNFYILRHSQKTIQNKQRKKKNEQQQKKTNKNIVGGNTKWSGRILKRQTRNSYTTQQCTLEIKLRELKVSVNSKVHKQVSAALLTRAPSWKHPDVLHWVNGLWCI